jgi:hypothetical protein
VANIYYGIAGIMDGWPFACYPTFASLELEPIDTSLEVSVLSAEGDVIPLNKGDLSLKFAPDRFRNLTWRILTTEDPDQLSMRLKALWRLWAREDVRLQEAATIRFYRVTLLTIPERRQENPVNRELLFELNLEAHTSDHSRGDDPLASGLTMQADSLAK